MAIYLSDTFRFADASTCTMLRSVIVVATVVLVAMVTSSIGEFAKTVFILS